MRIAILLAGVMLTAAMNVAHATTLLTGVDPTTGESRFFIGSGVGNVNRQSETSQSDTTHHPNEQINTSSDDAQSPIPSSDVGALISSTSNAIIEAIIASKAAIDQENQEYISKLQSSSGSEQSSNQDAIDRINKNLDDLVGNIVKNAISQGKLSDEQIQSMIDQINQQIDKKLDPDNTKPVQLSEQEKAKQAQIKLLEAERKKKQEAEKFKQEQLKKQNEALQAKLKEQLEKQKAEQEKAAEAAKKKAADEQAKKLTDAAAKAAFEAKQKALAEEKRKQEEAKKKAESELMTGAVAGMPKKVSEQDENQSSPSSDGNDPTGGGNNPLIGNGGDSSTPEPSAGNLPTDHLEGDRQELAEQIAELVSPGQGSPQRSDNQMGVSPADTEWTPETGGRYDPSAPVDAQTLHQLVNGSPMPPIAPHSLAGMLRDAMAMGLNDGTVPPTAKQDADKSTEDKLLRDFVEQVAALERFPYIAAGDVSALPPTESLTGAMWATYNGRLSGAFEDNTVVGGAIILNVRFDEQRIGGGITFDGGGNGAATVSGGWTGNAVDLGLSGTAYGATITEGWLNGQFYGPKGQELGGSWGMQTDDSSGKRTAEGQFATKQ